MRSPVAAYRLYGLTLESPLVLPCPQADRADTPDVCLHQGTAVQFGRAYKETAASHRDDWFQYRLLADGTTYLRWSGLFEFLISPNGRRILYRQLEHATVESFRVYLLGQVLSFSLLAMGDEPLHGTVVVVDGAAVALLGDCGYGKSTLGAALLARGFHVLTDDLMALEHREDGWYVHPGIPRIKLFPSIARRVLRQNPLEGTPMNHGTSKLVLPLGAAQTMSDAAPLKAVYVLSDPGQPVKGKNEASVHIERLSSRQAFLEVIRGAFNLLVLERQRFENQFRFATRLTASVPLRRLIYPRTLSVLPSVCDALLANLAPGSSAPGLEMVS